MTERDYRNCADAVVRKAPHANAPLTLEGHCWLIELSYTSDHSCRS